jgi:hypothetical protein
MDDDTAPALRSGSWTLLTGHGHVLVAITREPKARLRDIALRVGLTERAVQLIVADLVTAGYLAKHRNGRRNHYTVNPDIGFRHPDQNGHRVGPLLDLLATTDQTDGHHPQPAPDPHTSHRTGLASHLPHLGKTRQPPAS